MLYIPRRHRRKLLLPPGLLALAFLLLLGCGVIAPIVKERTKAVLQMTTLKLHPPTDEHERKYWLSNQELVSMRKWTNFQITGNTFCDWYSWQLARQNILSFHNSADSVRGTRIHFGENAKYEYMIKALSYLNEIGVRKYTLDMRTPVTTLYVLEVPQRGVLISCGTDTGEYFDASVPLKEAFDKLILKYNLQLSDFSPWFIAGLALVIMSARKLAASVFS
ncbi:hypothetical protein H8B13_11355 [Hymenobacter sp. BT188]|uniref:hypothetical protein n=1 Tax=Hymenobacter sp. BT188 TaxID=2763504 RepID=UPI001651858E|nr:hypothetical protein [Hymenobacter sp. BT188]MBC6607416.1 hypothetical protein [Hymenobacter sp. BT188]